MLCLLKPELSAGDEDRSRPSSLKLANPFIKLLLLVVVAVIGRGGLLAETRNDTGSEPVTTSAALILVDRFFFGLDFFPAVSSFLESFGSALGVSSPSLVFSSGSGVLSKILLLEFFLLDLRGDFDSLFLDFLPLFLLLTTSPPLALFSLMLGMRCSGGGGV